MKSGSMTGFEQARNVEDAVDGAPDAPAKKPPRELTLAAATKQVVAIRRSIPDELAAAKQKVLDDAAAREAKVLERVPAEARNIVRSKADAEIAVEESGPFLAEVDRAFNGGPPVQPLGEQVPEPMPRGVTDYVPGPVAQAARRGR